MSSHLAHRIEAVRRFNRFYPGRIGLLGEGYLDPAYTLTEARLLYEIAHREPTDGSSIATALGVGPGYLSRLRARLERGVRSGRRGVRSGRNYFT